MRDETIETSRHLAINAAREAGKMVLQLSKNEIAYQMKNSHDILAEGDLKSEKIIIDCIKQAFPQHSIFSEEIGEEIHKLEYLWVIDPIDGTINFSRGIEEYAISIALCHKDEIVLGVIYQPALDKLYVAEKGKGAFLNDKRISASDIRETINALVATDNSSKIASRKEDLRTLIKLCPEFRQVRIFGSGALHFAKIAEGKLDCYYKTRFHFWDFAAGILLITEAGGKVSDFAGEPLIRESKNIIASNGHIHNTTIHLLNQ